VGDLKIYRKTDAAITVFLSLILLLVLSMIMTVIEGARQTVARVIAERALSTAMDSVLAEFYGPLMEEYHLLGLDISFGKDTFDDTEITGRMKDYISYTVNPRQNLQSEKSHKISGISLKSVEVISKTGLMDYQGNLFIHEIMEYMKYRAPADAAKALLEKTSLLEQPKKVSILYEEKVKLEEEAVVIDEGILALMKYLDGVSTGKKGLIKDKISKIKTEKYFVKKILFETPTKESTGINSDVIFLALQDQYINPSGLFISIINNFDRLQTVLNNIAKAQAEENTIKEQIREEKSALSQLEEKLNSSDEDDEEERDSLEEKINDTKNRINNLEDTTKKLRKTISDYIDEKNKCIDDITDDSSEISRLVSGCLKKIEPAINELEQIIKAAESIEPKVIAYEDNLKKHKNKLSKEVYDSLEEGLNYLKSYLPDNNQGYGFLYMKELLKANYKILNECEVYLNEGQQALSGMNYEKAKIKFNSAYNKLLTYNTKGLNLDYSSLVLQKEESPDFVEAMWDLIQEGITGLVIDKKYISEKKLSSGNLPSDLALLSGELQGFSFLELLKKIKIGNKNSGLDRLFANFDDYSAGALLGDLPDVMAKRILLNEYINEHFYGFSLNQELQERRKPSALNYEREFFLFGKNTDKDNLEAVIMKLVLIRTVLNFTSILADQSKRNEAKLIASALVGFTGLPILVSITQSILMILLALASGLVDTCALLMGKQVPVILRKIDLRYADLLLMTGDYIHKKAESYKNEAGVSYSDYITFFMFLTDQKKLAYRMIDLIQENIKLRYGTNFDFQNCIYGYEAQAVFCIKPLFTTFAFVKEHINFDFNSEFLVGGEYSY